MQLAQTALSAAPMLQLLGAILLPFMALIPAHVARIGIQGVTGGLEEIASGRLASGLASLGLSSVLTCTATVLAVGLVGSAFLIVMHGLGVPRTF